jgi:predicted phosphodiesterase
MKVSRLSDMAIAVDYYTTKNLKPLMVISDVHWDSKDCDRKLLKKHLNTAVEQDAAIIIIGDFFDLMEGRNDMRRSNTARAEHYAPNYLQKVVMDAAEWLQPYAKNIAMISNGNHETSVAKHTQVQTLTWLCYELRKQGSQVIEGDYQGFFVVRAVYEYEGKNTYFPYKIFYHHGLWGGIISKGTQSVMRFGAVVPDADMIVTGHTHDQWMMLHTRYKLNKVYDVTLEDQIHLKLGTYKNEFKTGNGFAVEKIGLPKPIGGWMVDFNIEKNDVKNNVLRATPTMLK